MSEERKEEDTGKRCSLCNSLIEVEVNGWGNGHNPWPLRRNEEDRCCQTCNDTLVIPMRMKMLTSSQSQEGWVMKAELHNVKDLSDEYEPGTIGASMEFREFKEDESND
jgi:hypothetical protein